MSGNLLDNRAQLRLRKALLHSSAVALFILTPSVAHAQGMMMNNEPQFQTIDNNGVDVISGNVRSDGPDISMLSAEARLDAKVSLDSMFFDFGVEPTLTKSFWAGPTVVTFKNYSESFSFGSGGFSPSTSGATLTQPTSNTYLYTAKDGTKITFLDDISSSFIVDASSIKYTNGEEIDFYYDYRANAYFSTITEKKLITARNNRGYDIRYTWDFSSALVPLNSISAINLAVDYCNPTQVTCSTSRSWPTISTSTPDSSTRNFVGPSGETWRYTYGSNSRISGIRKPASSTDTVTVTYNSSGRVASIANGYGTWTYSYTQNTSVLPNTGTTTVTDPLGQTKTYNYNLNSYMTAVTDELGRTTSYGHDSSGRLTSETTPDGVLTQYTYDARANVTATTVTPKPSVGGTSIATSASYPSSCSNIFVCNQPTSTTDANGNQTDYAYDTATGLVTSVTSPAATGGAVRPQTRYSYTANQAFVKNAGGSIVATGLPITQLTGASSCITGSTCAGTTDEAKTVIDYGQQTSGTANNLLPVSTTTSAGDGSLSATTSTSYDAIGNPVAVDGPLSGASDTTVARYDASRRIVGVVEPDADGSGPNKNRAGRVSYNADGNPVKIEFGTVNSTSDTDWTGFAPASAVDVAYDNDGQVKLRKTSASGSIYDLTEYSYDTLGRSACSAVRMNTASFSSPSGAACTLGTAGSVGPDRITKLTYDAASEVTKVTSAYGTSDQSDDVTNTYTDDGRVGTVTDAAGNKTTYEYDGFDRLAKTRYPSTTKGAGTSSTTDYEQLSYDDNGNITTRRLRDATSVALSYDNLDRLTLENPPGSELDVSYTYDLLDRLLSAATSAQTLSFTYDALGRNLTQVSPLGTVSALYDVAGRQTQLTYPGSFYVTYDYSVTGQLTAIKENGSTMLATFAYDDLGRRTSLTRGNGVTTSYGFDSASRLASLGLDLSGSGDDLTLGFSYNPGSQTASTTRSNTGYSWTGAVNVARAYTSNGLNQYSAAGGTSFAFDARGNLTTSGSSSYTYSSENLLLTGPSSAALSYDPLMRLYQTSATGFTTTKLAYDGTNLIAEYDSSGTLQKRYVFGPGADEPLVEYDAGGNKSWLIADERGSIIAKTNASGVKIATNTYAEYGIPGSGNDGRFQYTGQTWLGELGMYYYKARIYSPTLGRFMQPDPIGYGDGMNWYNYAGGDPINATDPSGMFCFDLNDLGFASGGVHCSDDSDDIVITSTIHPPNVGLEVITITGIRLPSNIGTVGSAFNPSLGLSIPNLGNLPTASHPGDIVITGRQSKKTSSIPTEGSACHRALQVCEGTAVRLFDKGYGPESFTMRQQCYVTEQACYRNERQVQNNPKVKGGWTFFPPNKPLGGYVLHRKGLPPLYFPPVKDPLRGIPNR